MAPQSIAYFKHLSVTRKNESNSAEKAYLALRILAKPKDDRSFRWDVRYARNKQPLRFRIFVVVYSRTWAL